MAKPLEMRAKDIGLFVGAATGVVLGYFVAKDDPNLIVPKMIEYFTACALAGYSLEILTEASVNISDRVSKYLLG